MKYFTILILLVVIVSACKNNNETTNAYFNSTDEFADLQTSLKKQFSDNAYYLSIMLSYDKVMGNTVSVKVSRNSDSNNIEEWFFINDKWDKKDETKLDTERKNVSDLLFSLNDDYDLLNLIKIVEEAKEIAKKELNTKQVMCKSINLLMLNREEINNKMEALVTQITIESIDDGSTFRLNYDSKGNLKN